MIRRLILGETEGYVPVVPATPSASARATRTMTDSESLRAVGWSRPAMRTDGRGRTKSLVYSPEVRVHHDFVFWRHEHLGFNFNSGLFEPVGWDGKPAKRALGVMPYLEESVPHESGRGGDLV